MIRKTSLSGVVVIMPRRFEDKRGFFSESWNRRELANQGFDFDFVQDNHSVSTHTGTVRGLHVQSPPYGQCKLVRCGRGRFLDVAVDIRVGSPTYGQWSSEILSFENGRQVLIPAGFLHGFVTREPETEIIYKTTNYYAPAHDLAVRFDDPDIGIDWGIDPLAAIISDNDAAARSFRGFKSPFKYEG